MSSSANKPAHFVVGSIPFYGHARPLLSLTVNLLSTFENLHISFLTTPPFYPNIQAEIASHEPSASVLKRLRVIAVKVPPKPEDVAEQAKDAPSDMTKLGETMPTQLGAFAEGLPRVIRGLWDGQAVYDVATGQNIPALAIKPSLAIVDSFMSFWSAIVQGSLPAGAKIPELGFFPCSGGVFIQHFGTVEQGGAMARVVEGLPKLKAERPDSGDASLMLELYEKSVGKVETWPGHEPMYDYELFPQTESSPMPADPILALTGAYHAFKQSAGCVLVVCPDFEPASVSVVEKFFEGEVAAQFPKHAFQVGPQFSANQWNNQLHPVTEQEQPVINFLDKVHKERGTKSLIYVSFGSLFWPAARPDLITALVEALTAANKPFLIAGGSPLCVFEPGVREKIAKDGLGMVGGFVPQHHVLQHPVTGWFLSHCGSNSLAESLLFKVPLILWPMAADQPLNSNLVESLGGGIQLLQVRTGLNVGKEVGRSKVIVEGTREAIDAELKATFDLFDGPKGKEIRARTEELSQIQRDSALKGRAKEELLAFAQFMA